MPVSYKIGMTRMNLTNQKS